MPETARDKRRLLAGVALGWRSTRSGWDLATGALGLNLWVCFLVLPIAHVAHPSSRTVLILVATAPLALLIGVALRSRVLLLATFPLLLLLPTTLSRSLLSMYATSTFVLVTVSFLAYLLSALRGLRDLEAPPAAVEMREISAPHTPPYWRRRLRIYRWLAALAGVFPALLIFALFLHPGIQANLQEHFPGRAAEARSCFATLAVALWLGVFWTELWLPLREHSRGDSQLRSELEHLRRESRRGRPRARFYVYVALALGLMLALLIGKRQAHGATASETACCQSRKPVA